MTNSAVDIHFTEQKIWNKIRMIYSSKDQHFGMQILWKVSQNSNFAMHWSGYGYLYRLGRLWRDVLIWVIHSSDEHLYFVHVHYAAYSTLYNPISNVNYTKVQLLVLPGGEGDCHRTMDTMLVNGLLKYTINK